MESTGQGKDVVIQRNHGNYGVDSNFILLFG